MTIFLSICLERALGGPDIVRQRRRTGSWSSFRRPKTKHYTSIEPVSRKKTRRWTGSKPVPTSVPEALEETSKITVVVDETTLPKPSPSAEAKLAARAAAAKATAGSAIAAASARGSSIRASRKRAPALKAICVKGLPVAVPEFTPIPNDPRNPGTGLYSFPALLSATPEEDEEEDEAFPQISQITQPKMAPYEEYDPAEARGYDSGYGSGVSSGENSKKSSLEIETDRRLATGSYDEGMGTAKGRAFMGNEDCREPTSPRMRVVGGEKAGFWGGIRMKYEEWRCGVYWNKA